MASETTHLAGFDSLVRGKTIDLPQQESNIVRVFLSSTFTDTIHERNRLLKDVYPHLQRYCQERGLDFEVVDMRWGVRDTATADHLTSALCIKEIETCKRVSMGPHFVSFLGNKYGYRPLPPSIESDQFEKLLRVIQSQTGAEDDWQLLADWYIKDTNTVPPAHVLQPITAILSNFYSADDPDAQRKERAHWWKIFGRLQRLLQRAVRAAVKEGTLTEKESNVYFESVTEIEVRQGVKDVVDLSERCLFFVRDLEGLGDRLDDEATGQYINLEEDGSIDQEAVSSLENLRAKFLPSVISPNCINKFTLPWTPSGIDPAHPTHAHYLDDVCVRIRDGIKRMIDRRLESRLRLTDRIVSGLYGEVLHHAKFCETKCSVFHGRADVLHSMREFLAAQGRKPLVLHGVSGSGKTSVMAMLARHSSEQLVNKSVVILRFLGTSGPSSGIHSMIQSVCIQICYAYNLDQPNSASLEDYTELTKLFRKLLSSVATSERPLLLLLDSVDQLLASNDAHAMNWLPTSLSSNVSLVVSVLSEDTHNCLDRIRFLLPDETCYLKMTTFPTETGLEIVSSWLEAKNRKLTRRQLDAVSEAFSKCPQPLFLKLLFESVQHWKSFTEPGGMLPGSVRDAIARLFEQLESRHGQIVIAHTLGYLSATRYGITEAEIEDVLSCDDEVLNDVYQYWDPPSKTIIRTPPSLWRRIHYDVSEFLSERQSGGKTVIAWYHRQFVEAAKERYLGEDKTIVSRHRLLADMFMGSYSVGTKQPITLCRRGKTYPEADRQVAPQPLEYSPGVYNRRKLLELPHQLAGAGRIQDLSRRVLFDFDWLLTKLLSFSFLELMTDFHQFDEEIIILAETMYLASSNLKVDPYSLAGQLIGRLGDYGDRSPNVARLLRQAHDWIKKSKRPVFVPRAPCLIPPGGPLRTVFGGHAGVVTNVSCTPSRELMLTACLDADGDPMLNVWSIITLELVHTLQKKTGELTPDRSSKLVVCISKNSQSVIFGRRSLGVFSLVSGELLRDLDTQPLSSFGSVQFVNDDCKVLACASPGNAVCLWTVSDGKMELALEHPTEVVFTKLLSPPTENILLSVCTNGKLSLWSLKTGECLTSHDGYDPGKILICAELSPRSNYLTTGSTDGQVKIWDLTSDSIILKRVVTATIKEPLLALTCPTDRVVVLRDSSSIARVFDCPSDENPIITDLKGHEGLITCLATYTLEASTYVVTGSKDDTLKVWQLDGRCCNTLKGHSSWIADVTVVTIKDELCVLSGCNDKTVKMWIPTKHEVTKRDHHDSSCQCLALSECSPPTIGLSSSKDNHTKFWDLNRASCFSTVRCATVAMTIHDTQGVAICGTSTGDVVAFDLRTGNRLWHRNLFQKSVAEMTSAGRQRTVLVSRGDVTDTAVRVCDAAEQMAERFRLEGHGGIVTILRATDRAGDEMFLSASKQAGEIKVWDTIMGMCLHTMMHKQVSVMEVSPCNKYLATGSTTGSITVWSLEAGLLGNVVAEKSGVHSDSIVCLAFDQKSRYVVYGVHVGKNQLPIWAYQEKQTRYLVGHNHAVMSVSVTPNNEYVFSSSRDCTIKAWSLGTMQLLASFDCQSQVKYFKYVETDKDHYRFIATNQSGTVAMLDLYLDGADRDGGEQATRQHRSLQDTGENLQTATDLTDPFMKRDSAANNNKSKKKRVSGVCVTI